MKTKSAVIVSLLALTVLAAPTAVRWLWHDEVPILQFRHRGDLLQLGLRDDGVVVWREITNKTNSPAEAVDGGVFWYRSSTNNVWTNIIITPNVLTDFYPMSQ